MYVTLTYKLKLEVAATLLVLLAEAALQAAMTSLVTQLVNQHEVSAGHLAIPVAVLYELGLG